MYSATDRTADPNSGTWRTSTIPTPTQTDRRRRHPRTRQTGPLEEEEDAKPPASISTPLHRHQRLILELSDRQDNREAQQALEFGVTLTGKVTSGSQASRTREPWSPYVHHADPQTAPPAEPCDIRRYQLAHITVRRARCSMLASPGPARLSPPWRSCLRCRRTGRGLVGDVLSWASLSLSGAR